MPKLSKKAKAVYEAAKCYPYTSRIHLSDEGNLRSPDDVIHCDQYERKAEKPSGLWYSFGKAWASYLWDDGKGLQWQYMRLQAATHIYRFYLNYGVIRTIHTYDEFDKFEAQFANAKRSVINWQKVHDDYAGIEIRFLPLRAEREGTWYEHWDVSGGCIWHKAAVKKIKTLHQWRARWEKVI